MHGDRTNKVHPQRKVQQRKKTEAQALAGTPNVCKIPGEGGMARLCRKVPGIYDIKA
jgi:hypothetical protein